MTLNQLYTLKRLLKDYEDFYNGETLELVLEVEEKIEFYDDENETEV